MPITIPTHPGNFEQSPPAIASNKIIDAVIVQGETYINRNGLT